jgi:hypothetical protein
MLREEPVPRTAAESPLVARVRLRAQRRIQWLRQLWSVGRDESERWLAVSHSEVDRILADPEHLADAERSFYETDPRFAQLDATIAGADRAAAVDGRWPRLLDAFGLTAGEADLLALALAAELDPPLLRVYGYLLDEAGPAHPTPWLARLVFGHRDEHLDGRRALLRWALAAPADPAAAPDATATGWRTDPELAAWLNGDEPPPAPPPPDCLYPDQLQAMVRFASAVGDDPPVEIELVGPPGAGRRTLAAQFAGALGRRLLNVDVGRLEGDPRLALVRAARDACLAGAVPYWHGLDGLEPAVEESLHGLAPLSVLGVEAPRASRHPIAAGRRSLRLPALTGAERMRLWGRLSEGPAPAFVRDWGLLPGEIQSVAAVAPAGEEAVAEACRRFLSLGPGELFSALPCPYTWDDIVLAAPIRRHLEEFEAQTRLRLDVYEDWGFGRLVPLGAGVTALFAGPSGTGKTMAAQVIARSLGMDLYRVDLAGVMNKYIGETEKRLKQVFDACERANVLLLFDEADALFGRRTQVRDAHDRFANIEIDYLLQRMEQFGGVAVLATNRKSDLDTAFIRRLRFIVDFLPPGAAERRLLWRIALPDLSPAGEPLLDGVDFEALAAGLDMSGAAIKSAALAAAFLARAGGDCIGMRHIVHAARRELAKQTKELPAAWQGWT